MPNLTSVDRLTRFYESDANVFALMLISYSIQGTSLTASDIIFAPIEFLDWDCLTVGALGWGQIQIANANESASGIDTHGSDGCCSSAMR